MKIDNEIYKSITIEVSYNKETKCFSAYSKLGNSYNTFNSELNNFGNGFKTPLEAIENCKLKIDAFLKNAPKSYKELAELITKSLIWTGYEECHADEDVIEILVKAFNKIKD